MKRLIASALVRAVLVAILAVSAVSMASPCEDDLLVEVGASADRCVASADEDGSSAPAAPGTVCPCACHVVLDVSGAPSYEPVTVAHEVAPQAALHDLAAAPPPITHPPQALSAS